MREVLARVVLRMQNGRLSSALDAWWSQAQNQRRLCVAAEKVCRRLRNMSMAGAMDAWSSFVDMRLASKALVSLSLRQRSQALCSGLFRGWVAHIRDLRRLRDVQLKILLRFVYRTISMAFSRWSAEVWWKGRCRDILLKVVTASVRRAMVQWRRCVQIAREHSFVQSAEISAWHALFAHGRLPVMERIARRWRYRRLSLYFNSWQTFVSLSIL